MLEHLFPIRVLLWSDNTIHASLLAWKTARAWLVPTLEVARSWDAVIVHLALGVLRIIAALCLGSRVAARRSLLWTATVHVAIL